MEAQVCCVDQMRPGTKVIGGRWFCDEHYAKATRPRNTVWRSAAIAVVGLLVFVGAVVGLDAALKPDLTGAGLVLAGVVLAIVPAFLWLFFFYQQDRLEPEPVGQVARMFVIGLALAGAVGIPITDQLFKIQNWLYLDSSTGVGLTEILGSIFIVGAVEAFIVYAVVRYFIFDSSEFDERADGVIYATAAGLGYATALNLQFILANGGSALGTGEIFVAEVALAQAAFGGLLGYFLGRAKLERDPIWWLPIGLALTALLNGLFNILRGQLEQGTISVGGAAALPSFNGLLLAGGLAVVVTVIVSFLINRDISRSLGSAQPASMEDPTIGDRQANYAVVGTFAVMLVVGAVTWNNAVNGTKAFDVSGFKGAYPQYFSDNTGADDVLRAVDTLNTGAEFAITTPAIENAQTAEGVAAQLAADRSGAYSVYTVVESGKATVNGKPAFVQRFAYVVGGDLTGSVPEVQEGLDYIFVDGQRAVVVTLLASSDTLPDVEPLFARFLNSLSF
jgi:RsiW-degrading membrane proteinase PrsW (M82 family)